MTIEILQERQKWSLEQKIDHAVGTIESFMARTCQKPYVSFSGGKDSTVLLDICRRFVDPNLDAVFCNTGNEFPEIVNFVKSVPNVTLISPKLSIKEVIKQNGFPLVSKEVSHYIRQLKTTKSDKLKQIRLYGISYKKGNLRGKIPEKWKFLITQPFMISEKCCEILKKRPFAQYQKETGKIPIIGTMAAESKVRMEQYVKRGGCNSFDKKSRASYPLSIWTEKDIYQYIKKFKIPICSLYLSRNCHRTGCMFCGFGAHLEKFSRFNLVFDLHPNIYKAIMKYENNGITYRHALRKIGVLLPDEIRQLEIDF